MVQPVSYKMLTVSCRKRRKACTGVPDAGEPAFVMTQNTLKSPRPNLLDKIFANLYPTNIFQTLFDRYLTHMDRAPHYLLEFVCQAFEKWVKDRNAKLVPERKRGGIKVMVSNNFWSTNDSDETLQTIKCQRGTWGRVRPELLHDFFTPT